jgi:hypothetical protein
MLKYSKSISAEWVGNFNVNDVMTKISMYYFRYDLELLDQTENSFTFKRTIESVEQPILGYILITPQRIFLQAHGFNSSVDCRTLYSLMMKQFSKLTGCKFIGARVKNPTELAEKIMKIKEERKIKREEKEKLPKKPVGRPRKPIDPNYVPPPKLPLGRPRKPIDPNYVPPPPKPRGRPKKIKSD